MPTIERKKSRLLKYYQKVYEIIDFSTKSLVQLVTDYQLPFFTIKTKFTILNLGNPHKIEENVIEEETTEDLIENWELEIDDFQLDAAFEELDYVYTKEWDNRYNIAVKVKPEDIPGLFEEQEKIYQEQAKVIEDEGKENV